MPSTSTQNPEAPMASEMWSFSKQMKPFFDRARKRSTLLGTSILGPPRRVWLEMARLEVLSDTAALMELDPPKCYFATQYVDRWKAIFELELQAIDARINKGNWRLLSTEWANLVEDAVEFHKVAHPARCLVWKATDPADPSPQQATGAWELYVSGIASRFLYTKPNTPRNTIDKRIEGLTECILLTRSLYPPVCLASAHELLVSSLERYLAFLIALRNNEVEVMEDEVHKSATFMSEALGILTSVKKEHGW